MIRDRLLRSPKKRGAEWKLVFLGIPATCVVPAGLRLTRKLEHHHSLELCAEAGEMDGMEQSPQIKAWHLAQATQERDKKWMLSVMR